MNDARIGKQPQQPRGVGKGTTGPLHRDCRPAITGQGPEQPPEVVRQRPGGPPDGGCADLVEQLVRTVGQMRKGHLRDRRGRRPRRPARAGRPPPGGADRGPPAPPPPPPPPPPSRPPPSAGARAPP